MNFGFSPKSKSCCARHGAEVLRERVRLRDGASAG